jgi:hypothetical protein
VVIWYIVARGGVGNGAFGIKAKETKSGGVGSERVFIVLCLCNISSRAEGVGHADVDGVE